LGAVSREIDSISALVCEDVNDAVYNAGFATSQGPREEAFDPLFATLDQLEARLAGSAIW
jgi:glutathionyl-hydroquinone reductase